MMIAPENPSGRPGRGRKRKNRRPANGSSSKPAQQRKTPAARNNPGGIYTAPMDHNYRDTSDQNSRNSRTRGGFMSNDPDPIPQSDEAQSRIFAFVEDLFFSAKINETARKLNVKVEFFKTDKDLLDRIAESAAIADDRISLVIVEQDIVQALKAAAQVYCLQEGRVALQGAASALTRDAIAAAYFGV